MLQSFKMAIKSIMGNKTRSFLTMLGIIIGVAAVIILVSIVNGYMSSVMENFADMGVNQISVSVVNLPSRSLDVEDAYEFYEENTDIYDEMTPVVNVSGVVKYGNDSLDATSVTGCSEDYLTIKDYALEVGRNISYSDIVSRQKTCVAGYYVANELFGGPEKALGQSLKINGEAYTIVGVAERQNEDELEEGGQRRLCVDPLLQRRQAHPQRVHQQLHVYLPEHGRHRHLHGPPGELSLREFPE